MRMVHKNTYSFSLFYIYKIIRRKRMTTQGAWRRSASLRNLALALFEGHYAEQKEEIFVLLLYLGRCRKAKTDQRREGARGEPPASQSLRLA